MERTVRLDDTQAAALAVLAEKHGKTEQEILDAAVRAGLPAVKDALRRGSPFRTVAH